MPQLGGNFELWALIRHETAIYFKFYSTNARSYGRELALSQLPALAVSPSRDGPARCRGMQPPFCGVLGRPAAQVRDIVGSRHCAPASSSCRRVCGTRWLSRGSCLPIDTCPAMLGVCGRIAGHCRSHCVLRGPRVLLLLRVQRLVALGAAMGHPGRHAAHHARVHDAGLPVRHQGWQHR